MVVTQLVYSKLIFKNVFYSLFVIKALGVTISPVCTVTSQMDPAPLSS